MESDELEQLVRKQRELLDKKDKIISALCNALNTVQSNCQVLLSPDTALPGNIHEVKEKRHLLFEEDIFSAENEDRYRCSPRSRSANVGKGTCMLCLFPLDDSLHGSFAPKVFTLACGHTFHLLCLFETIQRRECRKACGECWSAIDENDQDEIAQGGKREKKEITRYSHSLATQLMEYKISSSLLTDDY